MNNLNFATQILLARNVVLSNDTKRKILNSSESKKLEILPLLLGMDKRQTNLFKKILVIDEAFLDNMGEYGLDRTMINFKTKLDEKLASPIERCKLVGELLALVEIERSLK